MTPAEEFRAARATLGMTQQQLGDALGFARRRHAVYDIEAGRRNPRKTTLLLLRMLADEKTDADGLLRICAP